MDIEDLGINTFWASTEQANANCLPPYDTAADPAFPDFLIKELHLKEELAGMHVHNKTVINGVHSGKLALPLNVKFKDSGPSGEERSWIQTSSLEEVFEALQSYQGRRDVKLVVGNTSSGYYKDENPRVLIDISHIPELLTLQETSGTLKVGAAVTIEKLILTLEASPMINKSSRGSVIRGLASHLRKLANPHVRHRASVGGNLIMAQQFSFDSDLTTLLLAVGSTLQLVGAGRNVTTLSLEEFLRKGSLEPGWLLECISVPLWFPEKSDPSCIANCNTTGAHVAGLENDTSIKLWFKSYRAAPRSLGNSLAYINAAFLAEMSVLPDTDASCRIANVRLAFGAFGKGHAIRAYKVESFLIGKALHSSVLLEAINILKDEIGPSIKGTKKSSYKSSVAVGFFFDFFFPFLASNTPAQFALSNGSKASLKNGDKSSSMNHKENKSSSCMLASSMYDEGNFNISGRQSVPDYKDDFSIGKPIEKFEAKIQASGEAVYVDDVPSPDHCLYAAFVPSTEAFAKVKLIDTKLAIASSGVVAFISANDIPKGGANVAAVAAFFKPESLFATDYVEYVGHPLGIMVADSPEHAKEAAAKVKVEYEVESSPILCVEDAVAKNSFFPRSSYFPPKASVGDIEKGFLEADHKILNAEVKTGSQYFFYMETQTALAIPDEDNCMVVYNSCQSPSLVQESVSACLGIPHHNVRVITRRVGGGFGGKAFRNVTVASACAVAAHRLRRPVRMYLDRKSDMIMMGGRHPVKASYSVGFKHDGKVTGFQAKIYIDGGWSQDYTAVLHVGISQGLFKYNWGSLDIDYISCKTNLSSKSAMRGPGYVQGSFIADTILEHVAAVLGLDVHSVISRNLHTIDSVAVCYPGANISATDDFNLPSLWSTMLKRMEEKEGDNNRFNTENCWLKRGLSIQPCVYDVFRAPIPARVSIFTDGSVVVEVGGIELGQGLWTKVKQATIYGLSSLRAKDKEGVELMTVRVVQADSMSLPHGGLTAHSTTSEGSCEAVTRACQLLVDRLMPLKIKKEEELAGCLSWSGLIALAKVSQVDLSAQVRWFPEKSAFKYLTYGVAATEVEVNTLTGAVTILQSDLIYDCGKSLNPAVDIGQIEGSFVQGIGFFLTEEHEVDNTGVLVSNGTWTYKPPTVDNIPQKFRVEMVSSADRQNRVLSSKACGEPPLLMAGTVHSAVRRAVEAARKDRFTTISGEDEDKGSFFRLDTPASMERVKSLCGLDRVEEYLNYCI